jgi:phospholipid/cholesterol/gamma-HCH transport system substrate-binding protein
MSSAAKIGIFMLIILGVLGFFVMKIEDVKIGRGAGTKKMTAVFDSVAGLDNKSSVRVAGVRVGKVTDVRLRPDGKAEVELEIDKDVRLHTNAFARVANLGLLGEKYVEIEPGSANAPLIPDTQKIVLRGSEPASMDDVTNQVSEIATDVKAITESLRATLGGQAGQARLNEIVENVRLVTVQMRELVAANRTNVDATLANARAISESLRQRIPQLAATIERTADEIGGTVGENREDVKVIVDNLRKLSSDLQTSTENLNAITGQVKKGEGTVGKLVYSDEAHDKLSKALDAVEGGVTELKNTLGRVGRIEMDLGINSDYYAGLNQPSGPAGDLAGNSRSAISLRLNPNPEHNRFYNIELADSPRGRKREKVFEETVTNPATGESTTTVTKETKFDRDFLVSAQVGWNLQPLVVRLGLIDSTGGAGVDYRYSERISATAEAFDFSKRYDNQPHLRLYGEYTFRKEKPHTPALFVRSGIDNPLNDTSFTFGGGIRWRDDDLKYLLGSIPIK